MNVEMTELLRERIVRYLALPTQRKLEIVNKLGLHEAGDYVSLCGIDLDKVQLKRAADRKIIEKVWEMMATADRQDQIERLGGLETEFEAHGGRGGELADEIDSLRTALYPDEDVRLTHNLTAEGLSIQVSRNETTGILVVDISTGDLADRDQHLDTAVPNIRIMVNEGPIRFDSDGSIIEEYEEE